jgi:hypothetical protein
MTAPPGPIADHGDIPMTTSPPPDLEVSATGKLADYSSSKSPAFTNYLLNAVINTAWLPNGADQETRTRQAHITLEVLRGFKPADEIEGMIAAQAVAMHQGAMECFRRAMIPDQPFDMAARMRKDGANLARGMTDMLAALDRKRGKGPQVVRVERVVVHQGGQAIVGTVQAGSAAAGGIAASTPPALEQDLPVIPLNRRAGPPPVLAKAGRHGEGGGA